MEVSLPYKKSIHRVNTRQSRTDVFKSVQMNTISRFLDEKLTVNSLSEALEDSPTIAYVNFIDDLIPYQDNVDGNDVSSLNNMLWDFYENEEGGDIFYLVKVYSSLSHFTLIQKLRLIKRWHLQIKFSLRSEFYAPRSSSIKIQTNSTQKFFVGMKSNTNLGGSKIEMTLFERSWLKMSLQDHSFYHNRVIQSCFVVLITMMLIPSVINTSNI